MIQKTTCSPVESVDCPLYSLALTLRTAEMAEENQKPTEETLQEKPAEETKGAEQQTPEKTQEPPQDMMRAVVLTGFGGLKSVKVQQKSEPVLASDEVLIRVKAW